MDTKNRIDSLISEGVLRKDTLKTDSRDVSKGDVFVAIKGTSHDGHKHIEEVINKGASAVICELPAQKDQAGEFICVEDTKQVLGEIACRLYGDPSGSMKVYGVTGTNGKTTTVFLIDHILNFTGRKSGFASTVFVKTGPAGMEPSTMTTPDVIKVNNILESIKDSGMDNAVIEVSSHALSQKRVCGVRFDSAVFTNITPEHLDYHGDMDSYFAEKTKIFSYLKDEGLAAINVDDPMVSGLCDTLKYRKIVTFGIKFDAEVMAANVKLASGGTGFDLSVKGEEPRHVSTHLIGEHNVYNMLAAVSALKDSGISYDEMCSALESAPSVPGRLEMVSSNAPFNVFVDYAHTPNALENVLGCLKGLAKSRLICVFGCGGDRDRTKRPVMGRIASEACDHVFITSDNPRTEPPEAILEEIEKGVYDNDNYSIIGDRREAIQKALETADTGDIVLIAGKGHEDYQILGEKKIHFSDREVASEFLIKAGY